MRPSTTAGSTRCRRTGSPARPWPSSAPAPPAWPLPQQLTRVGHTVAVYERDDKIGGLLRYGIPDFKMEKEQVDRRLEQMKAEGTRFRTGVAVGTDVTWEQLRRRYDAVVVATGATVPRDLPIPGPRPGRRALRHGLPGSGQPREWRGSPSRTRSMRRASTW